MELILWRHAEAEDGVPDLERRLTKRGERQAEKMAAWLKPMLTADWLIVASPAGVRVSDDRGATWRDLVVATG